MKLRETSSHGEKKVCGIFGGGGLDRSLCGTVFSDGHSFSGDACDVTCPECLDAIGRNEEIYGIHASRIRDLAAGRNCIVCNFFRTRDCPRIPGASRKSCPKWEYYLGREAT